MNAPHIFGLGLLLLAIGIGASLVALVVNAWRNGEPWAAFILGTTFLGAFLALCAIGYGVAQK